MKGKRGLADSGGWACATYKVLEGKAARRSRNTSANKLLNYNLLLRYLIV